MIGLMLGNRYEIIEQIGSGGMAIVYKAKCHYLDRFVAIKVLKDEFTEDEDFIRKFRRESQAAASLSHPNILNIYDVGYEEVQGKRIHYIVMEYIKGHTLKEIINKEGKLGVDKTLNYSIQIGEALSSAHKNGIIHRDIKPHNIMLTEDERIKVTDFGIARAVTAATITTTSNVLGSVHYFSPEQARGGYTDEKSDIYSLGIVMYEMLTGELPFIGETPIGVALKHVQDDMVAPIELDSNIPVELNNIIMKCVQKRQVDRYQSIDELLLDLKYFDALKVPTDNESDTDDLTRVIPVVSVNSSEDKMSRKPNPKAKENIKSVQNTKKPNNKNKTITTFAAIAAAFLLALFLFLGYQKIKDSINKPTDLTMPNLINLTLDDAKGLAEKMNFQLNVLEKVTSTEFDEGRIINQNVDEGVKIRPGYPVGVTVSLGKELVEVPLVVNRLKAEAEALLNEKNLRVSIEEEFSDTVPEGIVIGQDIEAASMVSPNTRVTIKVSKGTEQKEVIMIQLVGKTISEAMNELARLDLAVGEVKYEKNDKPANIVYWQEYEPGTQLETKTSVDLYVSLGPTDTTDPTNPENPTTPPANETNFTFVITPYTDRDETEVSINRIVGEDSTVVYKNKHKSADGPFEVTVKGVPGAEFAVYFDGIYQYSRIKEE